MDMVVPTRIRATIYRSSLWLDVDHLTNDTDLQRHTVTDPALSFQPPFSR
jgi:hypothetical protein